MGVEAKALHRGADAWELVVEKLVRVGPNYYKPRRHCIRGCDDILQTLDRLNQPELLEDAKRAMEGSPRAYQVSRGRLEASENVPTSQSNEDDTIRRLARQCARLESRVEALETALRGSRSSKKRSRSRTGSPLSESHSPGPASSPAEGASAKPKQGSRSKSPAASSRPQATHDDPQESSEAQVEATSSEAPLSEPSAKTEDTPPSESARLTFPEPSALSKAYADLLGDEVPMSEMPSFTLDDGAFYMTDLVDESDEVLGALVLDLRATVFQAGALTMLDVDARQAMFESGEPTADALDAMKELLTAQSRCFNSIPGNPHVRINSLRPPDAEKDAWLFGAVHTLTLRDPFEGRMLLASR